MHRLRARMYGRGKDAGAGTLEYVGIIFFVGLLIAGLLLTATPIGNKLAEKLCEAIGTSCPAGPISAASEKAPPARTCEQGSTTVEGGLNVSVSFVDGDRSRSVTTREMSDGTFIVEVIDDGGVGVSVGTGGFEASLAIDEYEVGYGFGASGGGGVTGGNGEEYIFDSQSEAEDFVAYVGRESVADGLSLATTGTVLQPLFEWGGKGVNWVINLFKGYDPPSSSNVSYYYGGLEGYGEAHADAIVAGGSAEAEGEMILGIKQNHDTGETTTYTDISGKIEGSVHAGYSETDPDWGVGTSGEKSMSSILETTVDADGNLSSVSMIESGMRDTEKIRENLGIDQDGSTGGNAYRLQEDIPVTDANREQVQEALLAIQVADPSIPGSYEAAAEAEEYLQGQVEQVGDKTYEESNVDSSNIFSFALAGELPGVKGAGIGVDSSSTESEMVDAQYWTPDGWKSWDACLD